MTDEIIDLTPAGASRPDRPHRPGTDLGGRRWAGIVPRLGLRHLGRILVPLGFVVAVFGGIVAFGESFRKYRTPLGWKIGVGGAGILAAGVALQRRRDYYELAAFEGGLIYKKGSATRTVRWPEVTAVTEVRMDVILVHKEYDKPDEQVGRFHSLRLQTKDGGDHRFELGAVEDSEQLTAVVHSGTLPHLVPRAAEKLTAGKPVTFGPVTLSAAGLAHRGWELPWSELAGVTVQNGVLVVARRGDRRAWAEVPCGDIPNVQVLLHLIKIGATAAAPPAAGGGPARPGASRYSVLEQYQPAAGGPRIGY